VTTRRNTPITKESPNRLSDVPSVTLLAELLRREVLSGKVTERKLTIWGQIERAPSTINALKLYLAEQIESGNLSVMDHKIES
jgi:hypothetical protein